MANLRHLFGFQKIEENEKLDKVIKETESRYSGEISDEDIEAVAGGRNLGSNTKIKKLHITK